MHEQYGIKYSRSGMTDWFIQHGFAYKRPKSLFKIFSKVEQ
ncbi:hypothetical protein RHABOEDO_001096 [Candidatus Rhabdochlamydia oedothoracis]|uniref:Winged helix-turn helix domain-containing protein n=1 Tax=Candidatus Rhabdochlamydia oedothoracis TaxID=2720720 RepID=A0ABX8V2Y9_9BACT|nr:hypothetical protein RHABOEDO_001096 [Candidatus Rhabdochlamydia oedothoracis]